MKIKINYNIDEKNIIHISYLPERDIKDGLVIEHGEMREMDPTIGHQPAIMHDLYKGVTDYPLPPDFNREWIKDIYVDDHGSEDAVIPKW